MFLSVCTIYFLNINGSGNLFSRHHNPFSMHNTCKVVCVRTVKMAEQFFYLLHVFVCIMLTEIKEIIFLFYHIVILK